MENCTNCKRPLKKDDVFCSDCGTKVVSQHIDCPNCQKQNDVTDSFCSQCGLELRLISPPNATATLQLDTTDPESVHKELLGQFMRSLRRRILVDHESPLLDEYLEAFYKTSFNKQFMMASKQIADEIIETKQDVFVQPSSITGTAIQNKIEGLVDFFIIHHCKNLNKITLPESILKYQDTSLTQIDLTTMIIDFFDWESEKEKIYTDFLDMPVDKLKAASQHFLFPPRNEKIWMICDQSTLGSCKEGFAITENGLYWKAHFQDPRVALFVKLESVERQHDWILINDLFFNVNPSVNLKMLYFLRKLKVFYSQK